MILEHSTIKFKVSGVDVQFDIWHNLPDTFGLSITDAVNSWVYRTDDYSSKSFCEYVLEKDRTLICVDKKV
jgi:hypothetical protein